MQPGPPVKRLRGLRGFESRLAFARSEFLGEKTFFFGNSHKETKPAISAIPAIPAIDSCGGGVNIGDVKFQDVGMLIHGCSEHECLAGVADRMVDVGFKAFRDGFGADAGFGGDSWE
jgi:hypothetical protein